MAAVKRLQASTSRPLTQQDILQAAVEEFAARGYRGTNLINVAERLGVTRQALYYYFPRKHDMLKAIMFEYFDGLEQSVVDAAEGTDDPDDRFIKMLAAHFDWVAAHTVETTVFMQEAGNLLRQDQEKIMHRRLRHQERFSSTFETAVKANKFRDLPPGLVVSTLLGAGNWSYRWFKPKGGRLTATQYAAFATALLRDGFGAALSAASEP